MTDQPHVIAPGHRGATPNWVAFYDPNRNGYSLDSDPRCLWGWGDCGHMHGHACFRPARHAGRCWHMGDRPETDDPECYSAQRPNDWDDVGRTEANV
jgi:hypothetical protein